MYGCRMKYTMTATEIWHATGTSEHASALTHFVSDGHVPEDEFYDMYTRVGTDPQATLDNVFERWNSVKGCHQFQRHNIRNLSVGDVVFVDGAAHLCAVQGWNRQQHLDKYATEAPIQTT